MTLCQVSTSALKKAAVSASDAVATSADRLSSFFFTSGSLSASLMSACSLSTIACGIFGGATSANQVTTTKPGTVSLWSARPETPPCGFSVASPSARIVPALDELARGADIVEGDVDVAGDQILHRRRRAAIVDVLEFDARHLLRTAPTVRCAVVPMPWVPELSSPGCALA